MTVTLVFGTCTTRKWSGKQRLEVGVSGRYVGVSVLVGMRER